jgi:hypothetical protein
MCHGILESCLCSVVPLYVLDASDPDDGTLGSFWECGALCLTVTVIIVNLKMIFIQSRQRWEHYVVIFLSIGSWFAFSSMVDLLTEFPVYNDMNYLGTWSNIIRTGAFWIALLFLIFLILSKDICFSGYQRCFKVRKKDNSIYI